MRLNGWLRIGVVLGVVLVLVLMRKYYPRTCQPCGLPPTLFDRV